MNQKQNNTYLPGSKDRIRVFNLIDWTFELSVRKGPHPFDIDCQCIACMTKRKKRLYPMPTEWTYTL
ncbi:MAG: hypothetical protein KKD44_21015 [Proteobacteria bacterium]|nr:hypothetical protein [Pseudomonadota bacterium]